MNHSCMIHHIKLEQLQKILLMARINLPQLQKKLLTNDRSLSDKMTDYI
jgi:hypothetical protein